MKIIDKENVIKALECCENTKYDLQCDKCPLQKTMNCNHVLNRSAIALIKELIEEIKNLEADYERVYEQAEADIHGNIADGGTSCHWCMDKTRDDTVRKMQEKLKAELDERYSLYFRILGGELIDRIAEELLEEKKDVEE